MCNFFSFVTAAKKPFYFNWADRQRCLSGELNLDPDSHASIASFHKLNEDRCNKYEYNPLTGVFIVDQINAKRDDSKGAERWVRLLDFSDVVEPLRIKPIVHPFHVTNTCLSARDKANLKAWASVRDSVWASVWASVGYRVWDSVRASVGDSVGASVRASVWASVWDSVRASVGASVGDSVWASVRAYIGSFFDIADLEKFQPCVDLWERGFVPSFDGKVWRLHHGPDAKIVYEITAEELRKGR